ncbi:MAG: FGGY-family carbohydrate kinase, partial [Verrucomicrobiota bacterium]|nr:FGGY-family carbohydrate kinase [Verrucomicrobiota bacterium]
MNGVMLSVKKELYNITGYTAHAMFTLFKLLWLRKNKPKIWQNTSKFLCFEDLLQYKLGIEPAISWSLAGRTMMFDIKKHCWDDSILKKLELDSEKLARPTKSGSIVGVIPIKVAEKLGLENEVKVVAGGHDQSCGALGAGVTREGLAMYATGTIECITPAFSRPSQSDSLFLNNLCTYDYTIDQTYTTVAFSLTGGNMLKWIRDVFGYEELLSAKKTGTNPYELLLEKMSSNPTNLLVLPHFTPTGTPYFDSKAYGAILGLSLSTDKGDIIRALLEGVAFEMRLNIDILNASNIKIKELRAIGGGAKSSIWTQLKADVLNKPIVNVKVTEAGCLGAAALAFAAETKNDISKTIN